MFKTTITKYQNKEINDVELTTCFFKILHSNLRFDSKKKIKPETWTKHPIGETLNQMYLNSKDDTVKKAIKICINYAKAWWQKATDTYLFPTYALTLFLNKQITYEPECFVLDSSVAKKIYENMELEINPIDLFTKTIVASDQHTFVGRENGVGRLSKFSKPTFVFYHSAVRPYTNGFQKTSLNYIKTSFPNIPEDTANELHNNLIDFGLGKLEEKELWDKQTKIMRDKLKLPDIIDYNKWKWLNPTFHKAKTNGEVKHPNTLCELRRHGSPIQDGWYYDSIISLMQKSIRRSNLYNSQWAVCRILMFGLFHTVIKLHKDEEIWTIYKDGLAKITNLINRLRVITAEDFYPCAKLFVYTCNMLEQANSIKEHLKKGLPKQTYQDKFYELVAVILSVITTMYNLPKQHYVGVTMAENKSIYEESCRALINKRKRIN